MILAGSFRQLLPEAIQQQVREGKFPAQAALNFLAPSPVVPSRPQRGPAPMYR
jgi:hypothetical protein